MNTESIQGDTASVSNADTIRRWTVIKTVAVLIAACGVLLGTAGTVIGMINSFSVAAESARPVPVDSLADSIGSSLQLGMWLTPIIIVSVMSWLVARAKLRTLNRSRTFSPGNTG